MEHNWWQWQLRSSGEWHDMLWKSLKWKQFKSPVFCSQNFDLRALNQHNGFDGSGSQPMHRIWSQHEVIDPMCRALWQRKNPKRDREVYGNDWRWKKDRDETTEKQGLESKSSDICPSDWVEVNGNREARFQVKVSFNSRINASWRFCMFSIIGRELSGGMPPHEISDWGCYPNPTRQDSNFSLTSFGMQEMRWATEFEHFSLFKFLLLPLFLAAVTNKMASHICLCIICSGPSCRDTTGNSPGTLSHRWLLSFRKTVSFKL